MKINGELRLRGRGLMVNQEELAVCRRRGHDVGLTVREEWSQCRWCGMWLRSVNTVQEREDDPPENKRNSLYKYR